MVNLTKNFKSGKKTLQPFNYAKKCLSRVCAMIVKNIFHSRWIENNYIYKNYFSRVDPKILKYKHFLVGACQVVELEKVQITK